MVQSSDLDVVGTLVIEMSFRISHPEAIWPTGHPRTISNRPIRKGWAITVCDTILIAHNGFGTLIIPFASTTNEHVAGKSAVRLLFRRRRLFSMSPWLFLDDHKYGEKFGRYFTWDDGAVQKVCAASGVCQFSRRKSSVLK